MIQQYVIYTLSDPFLGYIRGYGEINSEEAQDGSSTYEYIQRVLSDTNLAVYVFESRVALSEELREDKKFDPGTEALVDLEAGDITPKAQAELNEAAKMQALVDNLPSWSQVDEAITAIGSLADAKVFIRKLARVVYWLAKNSEA